MKNHIKFSGIITLTLIMVFTFAACSSGDGDDSPSGSTDGISLAGSRWETMGGLGVLTFNSATNYTMQVFEQLSDRGTYVVSGDIITFTITELGPMAGDSRVGDKVIMNIINNNTLHSDDEDGEYYWTRK